jgi:hypothetical protein
METLKPILIEAINAIPFVSVPVPELETLRALPGRGGLSRQSPGSAHGHRPEAERDH